MQGGLHGGGSIAVCYGGGATAAAHYDQWLGAPALAAWGALEGQEAVNARTLSGLAALLRNFPSSTTTRGTALEAHVGQSAIKLPRRRRWSGEDTLLAGL